MKKTILAIIAIVILLVLLIAWGNSMSPDSGVPSDIGGPGSANNDFLPASTTMQGVFVCLPHRDTSGPQTMECAYGLKANSGEYYATDWSQTPNSAFDFPMDRQFSISGTLVPIEAISSDLWQKYNIKGIIQVNSYQELATGIPTVPVGLVTLALNKPVMIANAQTTLRIVNVLEDSRCPTDVTCIQAGRVRVTLNTATAMGTSSMEMEVGNTMTTETLSITLSEVRPSPVSTYKIADNNYRFVLMVRQR